MQKILSRMSFIGFGIQIVLGILWMCNAFAGVENPGEGIVCVGAMLLVGAAILFFKRSIWVEQKRWMDAFVVASVSSFPFVMQSMVYPDRRILITAALLFGAGGVLRLMRSVKGVKMLAIMLAFWVAAGGIIVGVESYGREKVAVSTRLTERIAWTTLYDTYINSPKETKKTIPYREMLDSTYESVGIEMNLAPALIERHGEEKAPRVMKEICSVAWQYGKGQIIKEIIWDGMGYTFSPVVVTLQLEGRAYDSYTGMNYRELLQMEPKLGKFYTYYSCWWFVVAFVCAGVFGISELLKNKRKPDWRKLMIVLLPAFGMIVGYTLNGAGRMDYKNTLYVLCIWLIWMISSAVRVWAQEQVVELTEEKRDEKE